MSGGVRVECFGVMQIYPMPDGDVVALRGVDLDIPEGDAVALLGPSGAGKSTVLSLLAGMQRPSAGRVRIGNHDIGRMSELELLRLRRTEVGVVMQDPGRNLLPYASTLQNIAFAQRALSRRQRRQVASPMRLLQALKLEHLARRPVAILSGGEQQRAAMAVGFANSPRLLLVDEPTSHLDAENRDAVLEMLATLNDEFGTTVVAVTHDQHVAAAMKRTITIRDGRVGSEGRAGQDFAVVGSDGVVQLPPHILQRLPPGTLVRVIPHDIGADLRDAELGPGAGTAPKVGA